MIRLEKSDSINYNRKKQRQKNYVCFSFKYKETIFFLNIYANKEYIIICFSGSYPDPDRVYISYVFSDPGLNRKIHYDINFT